MFPANRNGMMERDFLPRAKNGSPDQKSRCCTCAQACYSPFKLFSTQQQLGDSTIRFPRHQMWCVVSTRKQQNSFVITRHINCFFFLLLLLFQEQRPSMITFNKTKLLIRITVYPISASVIPQCQFRITRRASKTTEPRKKK